MILRDPRIVNSGALKTARRKTRRQFEKNRCRLEHFILQTEVILNWNDLSAPLKAIRR